VSSNSVLSDRRPKDLPLLEYSLTPAHNQQLQDLETILDLVQDHYVLKRASDYVTCCEDPQTLLRDALSSAQYQIKKQCTPTNVFWMMLEQVPGGDLLSEGIGAANRLRRYLWTRNLAENHTTNVLGDIATGRSLHHFNLSKLHAVNFVVDAAATGVRKWATLSWWGPVGTIAAVGVEKVNRHLPRALQKRVTHLARSKNDLTTKILLSCTDYVIKKVFHIVNKCKHDKSTTNKMLRRAVLGDQPQQTLEILFHLETPNPTYAQRLALKFLLESDHTLGKAVLKTLARQPLSLRDELAWHRSNNLDAKILLNPSQVRTATRFEAARLRLRQDIDALGECEFGKKQWSQMRSAPMQNNAPRSHPQHRLSDVKYAPGDDIEMAAPPFFNLPA
jgi:hypothetical protein